MFEYGIFCNIADEKKIVRNINNFLHNSGYRKMYKRKHDSISKLKYDYYYCQFMKQEPRWYFDLYLNEDLNGNYKFKNNFTKWVLYTSKTYVENYTENQHAEVDLFFKKLVAAIGFETVLLHEYKDGEERIGNYTTEEMKEMFNPQ